MDVLAQAIQEALTREMQRRGKLGGINRAKNLTPKERRASALKASRAAALARTRRAKLKKAEK